MKVVQRTIYGLKDRVFFLITIDLFLLLLLGCMFNRTKDSVERDSSAKSKIEWTEKPLKAMENIFSDKVFDGVDKICVYRHNKKNEIIITSKESVREIVELFRNNSFKLKEKVEFFGNFVVSSNTCPCMCLLFELFFKRGDELLLHARVHGHYGIDIKEVSEKEFENTASMERTFENRRLREYLVNMHEK